MALETKNKSRTEKTARAGFLAALALCLLSLDMRPVSATPAPSKPAEKDWSLPSDRARPANPYTLASAVPFPALDKKLRSTSGFVGGDAAYSIVLDRNKSLWLFGDSFIGDLTADGKRTKCKMVRNTVAIDDPTKTAGRPTFYNQEPAFFRIGGGNFYWPGDGAMLNGKLYLFMHETENAPKEKAPFQFNPLTDHLLIIQNPLDKPSSWKVKEFRFGNPSSNRQLGVATLLDGDFMYIYLSNAAMRLGFWKNPTALARMKKSDLEAGKIENLQWLSDGQWASKPVLLDLMWEDGTSEMTVTRMPGLPGFFAYYLPFGNNAVMMRHADKPEGPWSKPIAVYNLPKASKDIFFYSAKAHPQYVSARGEMAITYCTNSSVFSRVINDSKLYFPESIKIKLCPKTGLEPQSKPAPGNKN